MKIALVHNFYRQAGGEDTVFETEKALLEDAGHQVVVYTRRNEEISRYSPWQKLSLLKRAVWADDSARDLHELLRRERPDLVHFHNTFPLISPAAYYVVKTAGLPVVQTLHNYRLFCLNGLFFRDGKICEDCLGKFVPWPGIVRGTYRNSRLASGLAATMLTAHRVTQTWAHQVDLYIATTEFARAKFIAGGLPADRIVVKPNGVRPDPGPGEGRGGYALFAGRLSAEKGVETLLAAWQQHHAPLPLKIAGDGPLADQVAAAARANPNIEWLGWVSRSAVLDLMKNAAVLLFPSIWYEIWGNGIAEAFATGLPVIASNLGSMASLVKDGSTGLLAQPGDGGDLARKVAWVAAEPDRLREMRENARRHYETQFSPEQNYRELIRIYAQAIERVHRTARTAFAASPLAANPPDPGAVMRRVEKPLKVALVHNFYREPGGEDTVFETEKALLEDAGHQVVVYTRRNEEISRYSPWQKLSLLKRAVWAHDSARDLRDLLHWERPDLVHFHNTFPLISPAAYYVVKAAGLPVVQTLHNYRLFCLNGLFFRDGKICEDCLGKFVPWPGIVRGTYRNSRLASGLAATTLTAHRLTQTWAHQVDLYIATNEFARTKFIAGGLPADRIVVKPNGVRPDPGPGEGRGGYALFAGRLSPEKGVETLLAAWQQHHAPLPLKIAGDGPLADQVAAGARANPNIEWLGWVPRPKLSNVMKDAGVLIFPSLLYENFPMAIAEALSTGLPVIASNLGSMASVVAHGRNGLLFRPGDSAELAGAVQWMTAHTGEAAAMRREARRDYETRFSPDQNYRALTQAYALAIERAQARGQTREAGRDVAAVAGPDA